MAINRRLQFVRGNTARNDAFTGREGELTVDTTTWTLRVHDGVTPGGNALGTSNFSGDYNDLTNKPTIPTFDGAYSSLTGTPDIPTDLSDLTDNDNLIPTDISQLGDATGVIPTDVSQLTDTHNIILTLPQIIVGLATETYVNNAISDLVNAAPGTLDTLNELAAAIGDDPNYASTVAGLIGAKANTADLATVATTGRYLDLTDKPFIPTDVNELTDASGLLDHFSGSYNDLSDKPVLFSGAYADLTGKPTIPSLSTFSFGTNTITTSNGDDGITLKISGATSDPDPAFVQRTWRLADSGAIQFLDPFLETVDAEITTTKVSNWDTAYGWGNHSTAGYVSTTGTQSIAGAKTITDPLTVSVTANYNTAVLRSSGAEVNLSLDSTSVSGRNYMLVSGGTGGAFSGGRFGIYDADASAERFGISNAGAISFNNAFTFPTADGTSGQVLTTDGSGTITWQTPQTYVASDTTGITGADQVTNMVTLTQAEYDAITPNASTVYFIVG